MKWPMVPLGDVIVYRKEFIQINDLETYKRCRVQLHAQGIVLRDAVTGAEIKTKKQQVCKAGDFLVAEIDAKVGGFGIVPEALEGAIVSSHYFLFEINKDKLDRNFLDFFIRTPFFRNQVEAQGSTNYAAIHPQDVLEYKIPLPPLSEQKRLVTQIEELAAKVEEAKGLRGKAVEEAEAVFASASDAIFKKKSGWAESLVGDFCEPPQYGYTESATYDPVGPKFLRITDIQNGQVNWDKVPFCQCTNPEQYLLQADDLVFARTGATTGKSFLIRKCPKAVFASYLIRLRVKRLVSADYLYHYFQTPSYWQQITEEKKGTGQPNVNGQKLASIRVPIAPREDQRRIIEYLDSLQSKIDELKKLQSEAKKELNVLMPSILDKAFKGNL